MSENELYVQHFPAYSVKSANRRRMFLFIVLFVVVLAVITGGLYMIGYSQRRQSVVTISPIISPAVSPLPTSSASAVLTSGLTGTLSPGTSQSPASPHSGLSTIDSQTHLDRSELGVAVLNGSGETGAAGEVSSYLEGLGYKILRVGNADAYTYKSLTVMVKKSKSSYAGLLRKDLQANPSFAPSNGAVASVSASIADDISSEAVVIVGK